MTRPDMKGLREAAGKATPGPWSYRPNQYDDWGILRAPDSSLVAVSRGDAKDYSPWRADPYAPNGQFIALANPSTILSLLDYCEGLEKALTPSADTKAEYMGEFTIAVDRYGIELDEPDDETARVDRIPVPWTTIKEIMAAIRKFGGAS